MTPSSPPTFAATADLAPDPEQPRSAPGDLTDLIASIHSAGRILQPILVSPNPASSPPWLILAGERRWRSALALGYEQVPILVCDSKAPRLLLQLAENDGRENLSLADQARAVQKLLETTGLAPTRFAAEHGLDEARITRLARLATEAAGPVVVAMSEGLLTDPRAAVGMLALEPPAQEALLERARSTERPISRAVVSAAGDRAEAREDAGPVRVQFNQSEWELLLEKFHLPNPSPPAAFKAALLAP